MSNDRCTWWNKVNNKRWKISWHKQCIISDDCQVDVVIQYDFVFSTLIRTNVEMTID